MEAERLPSGLLTRGATQILTLAWSDQVWYSAVACLSPASHNFSARRVEGRLSTGRVAHTSSLCVRALRDRMLCSRVRRRSDLNICGHGRAPGCGSPTTYLEFLCRI